MNPAKKQQSKFFLNELIAFALLFSLLGLIVYSIFQNSVYLNINRSMANQKEQILENKTPEPLIHQGIGAPDKNKNRPDPNGPFRFNFLVFDKNGNVKNDKMLGQRNYELLHQVKLQKKQVNQMKDLVLTNSSINSHFRSLLIKVPKDNSNKLYAGNYVLILENVDSELLTISSFKLALIITIFIFAILAIIIAYLLSRFSMKPIIQSWKRQRDFSSNAAHELKTPLTVIQNQLEYLLTKPNQKIIDEAEEIATALDEVQQLETMTKKLLMLARSDSDLIQLNKTQVDLKPWLDNILHPYQEITLSQHKSLINDLKITGNADLDPSLIRQLLVILLDNAIKYTPEGGTITIKGAVKYNNLIIEVTDTGNGISDQDKSHIFERFYRTDRSRNSKTGGNGLGLAIAKWIIDQHNGEITVRDNQPHGAIFKVRIPIKNGSLKR